jgi:hypothetical protein
VSQPEARLVDGAVLARDRLTGQFRPTEGISPHIADRRAQVAKLYPEKTLDEIGVELGYAKPTIWQDVRALGLERRRPGPRPKYPIPESRKCANPDCLEVVTPEPNVAARGYGNFCSIPCARATPTRRVRERARELRTEWRRRADEEIARLNDAGYLTSRQLAAERRVTESAVSRYIAVGLLRAKRCVIEGEPHQLVRREEFERFNVADWPSILERMGPGLPRNWSGESRRLWSRRLRAREVGQAGGRPVEYDDEQARKVHVVHATYPKWGRVRIAEVVRKATGKPLTPDQVRGILQKPLT